MLPNYSTELHVLCGYVLLMAVVGVVGNLLVLLVYTNQRDRRVTSVFIRALAGLDLSVSAVVMPYTIVYEYRLVTSSVVCTVCEISRHFNVAMSNLTLVAVAVERYVAICRPTFTVTPRHVQKGLIVIIAVSVVFSAPSATIFAVIPVFVETLANSSTSGITDAPVLNVTAKSQDGNFASEAHAYCAFTTTILGPTYTSVYQGFQMIVWFSCIIIIIVLYCVIYCAVWKRDRPRNLVRVRPVASFTIASEYTEGQETNADPRSNQIATVGSSSRACGGSIFQRRINAENGMVSVISNNDGFADGFREEAPPGDNKGKRGRIRRYRKTGTMLFLCTVVYIFTWVPFWLDIFGATNSIVFRHMFFLSTASNPVIYGLINAQVRRAMFSIICGRKRFPLR